MKEKPDLIVIGASDAGYSVAEALRKAEVMVNHVEEPFPKSLPYIISQIGRQEETFIDRSIPFNTFNAHKHNMTCTKNRKARKRKKQ